eukprot:scaffold10732_cov15-Tisochrysis_lutea.AAC.1
MHGISVRKPVKGGCEFAVQWHAVGTCSVDRNGTRSCQSMHFQERAEKGLELARLGCPAAENAATL